MISFKSGTKLAEVEYNKGKGKNKFIYVKDDEGKGEVSNKDKVKLLPKSFFTSLKKIGRAHV